MVAVLEMRSSPASAAALVRVIPPAREMPEVLTSA